jgi:two-component system response regulator AlgR
MSLRVLIVDDEALARVRLKTLLADCTAPQALVLGEAANTVQAIEFLQHHVVDVVLADIHMPGADGLSLAQALHKLTPAPAVIFVTAYAEHAVQAFELEAADYLTKPVRLERLQIALQKVERLTKSIRALEGDSAEDFLSIQERGRWERVPVSQVLYLKAELKYITVRTLTRSHVLEGSLSDLEAKFAGRFMRIHRNALVARRAIQSLEKHHDAEEGDGWAVRVSGLDELLLVSRRQLAAVRELVAQG